MDPDRDIENDVSPGEGNSSYYDQQNLPSYEEAIKVPLAKCTEAPPPSYAEVIGNSRLTSSYPYPPPDDRDTPHRPLCRNNSDLIIVRLLSGIGNDVVTSRTQHGRPVGQLSADRVRTGSQPSVYNRSLAKRVQLCFVFIVVAVIIVAGAITTSVIKSTKTDRLSPIEIPTIDPDLFPIPKPTKLTHDSSNQNKENSSRYSPWNRESTTSRINWKYYSEKWSKYWRKLNDENSNRRNSTQRRNVYVSDVTTPSDSQVSYAANDKLTFQCLSFSLVLSCVFLFQ